MDGRTGDRYTFVCPTCGASHEVDDPTRDAILEAGCVICGAAVTPSAFSSTDA